MSCDWDLCCRTCGDHPRAGIDWNHGDKQLAAFLADGGLEKLAALANIRVTGVEIKATFEYHEHYRDLIAFCAAHAGHDVGVRNEYGNFDDACAKPVECGACTQRYRCVLKKDHAGACAHDRLRGS